MGQYGFGPTFFMLHSTPVYINGETEQLPFTMLPQSYFWGGADTSRAWSDLARMSHDLHYAHHLYCCTAAVPLTCFSSVAVNNGTKQSVCHRSPLHGLLRPIYAHLCSSFHSNNSRVHSSLDGTRGVRQVTTTAQTKKLRSFMCVFH